MVDDASRVVRIVFAVNRVWQPTHKRLADRAATLVHRPERLAQRIEEALTEPDPHRAVLLLTELQAETVALAPDGPNINRARKWLSDAHEILVQQAAYDEVAEAYHRTFDPDGVGLRDTVFDSLVGAVAGQDVLALACGQGQDARRLADLGARVVGVDISEPMLDYARKYEEATPRGIRYVQGDAQTLSAFSADSFDGVSCHMALMDIPKLEPTISSVARVLRPDGWFVFSIVHPCYGPHVDIVATYLSDTRYQKRIPGDALPRHAYHRPLSDYINTLAQARLSITRVVEHYHETNDGHGVPGLLYLRCLKTSD